MHIHPNVKKLLQERSRLFNQGSTFSGCKSCNAACCTHPQQNVDLYLTDLLGLHLATGLTFLEIAEKYCFFSVHPHLQENSVWYWRVQWSLKKPCPFLSGNQCTVYDGSDGISGRPMACAVFPETEGLLDGGNRIPYAQRRQKYFPCGVNFHVSETRKKALEELGKMMGPEMMATELYLFGVTPVTFHLNSAITAMLDREPRPEGIVDLARREEKLIDQTAQKPIDGFLFDETGLEARKIAGQVFRLLYPEGLIPQEKFLEKLKLLQENPSLIGVLCAAADENFFRTHYADPSWKMYVADLPTSLQNLFA